MTSATQTQQTEWERVEAKYAEVIAFEKAFTSEINARIAVESADNRVTRRAAQMRLGKATQKVANLETSAYWHARNRQCRVNGCTQCRHFDE